MSTALYRRYRPDTFADVIGQEHVTEPLVAAIDSGRINHAYLFSGPRGCGKTTSARIFARCLNCVNGPTGTPCGECESCVELARGGSGSLDVVELDAASHGGVDDARDLRERAIFAPARDRYKIFIIDEAHMVTTQGFNALLKLVEEPPEHVKFVFATTEPEKVIGTIRSRTHHYPFRLVPPDRLTQYLADLSQAENIEIENGVIPLVVRAGAGSVRDSLSVLDQLMAGAIDGVVTYQRAVALLGYTPDGLLDDAVGALAAQDGAGLFAVVDQVISSGHSPRRFAEDLLERFRDLIVVLAAKNNAAAVLPEISPDQLERMRTQAQHLGAATCSRAADLVHDALAHMAGATSPRLQLELLCARLLLPTAEEGVRALAVRLDRIESAGGSAPSSPHPSAATPPAAQPAAAQPAPERPTAPEQRPQPVAQQPPSPTQQSQVPAARPPVTEPAPAAASAPEAPTPSRAWQAAAEAHQRRTAPAESGQGAPRAETPQEQPVRGEDGWPSVQVPGRASPRPAASEPPARGDAAPAAPAPNQSAPSVPAPSPPEPAQGGPTPAGPAPAEPAVAEPAAERSAGLTVQQLRNRWPEVLQTLARVKRSSWALVAQDAQVVDLHDDVLTIGFSTSGLASAFQGGAHAEPLSRAIAEGLGLNVRIETTIVGAGGGQRPAPTSPPQRPQPAAGAHPGQAARPRSAPGEPRPPGGPAQRPQVAPGEPPRDEPSRDEPPYEEPPRDEPPYEEPPRDEPPNVEPPPAVSARPGPADPRTGRAGGAGQGGPVAAADDFDDYSPDDEDLGGSDLVGPPLVAKMLGGTVIDEIVED